MRGQWGLILAFIFALIVAVFSVINVNDVQVHYLFGVGHWPLILVILVSAVLGAIIVGGPGIVRLIQLQHSLRQADRRIRELEKTEVSGEGKNVEQKDTKQETSGVNVDKSDNGHVRREKCKKEK